MFALKAIMKLYPNRALLISLMVSIFAFAHILRIAERPVDTEEQSDVNFSFYFNALWCTTITIFTSFEYLFYYFFKQKI